VPGRDAERRRLACGDNLMCREDWDAGRTYGAPFLDFLDCALATEAGDRVRRTRTSAATPTRGGRR